MTERFVAPGASNILYTRANPGSVSGAIALSAPDDFITGLSGTYTGALYMLIITGVSPDGTAGHPITFRADVDGGVLFDGQDVRVPVEITSSAYWILEGFDARNSNDEVCGFGSGSDHCIIRRVVGCNSAVAANSAVFWDFGGTNNLLEDIGAFGTGRKMISNGQAGDSHLTVRRAFECWMKSTSGITGDCGSETNYLSQHGIWENIISTCNQQSGSTPASFEGIVFSRGVNDPADGVCTNTQALGCITYHLNSQTSPTGLPAGFVMGQYADCQTVKDNAVYIEKSIPVCRFYDVSSVAPFTGPSGVQTYTNGVEIGPTATDIMGSSWTVINRRTGTSVSGVFGSGSLWDNPGNLYRYVDGVLTAISAWPFPMTQRIIDAMTREGYTPINVDEDIQAIFGVPPTIIPGSTSPVDNFDSYTIATNLNGFNGGTNWTGAWIYGEGATMTVETAPSGFSGKSVQSIGNGTLTYYYRLCQPVSSDSLKWAMMSSVTNPNSDDYGVSLHESGVNVRTQVQFSSGGNIRAYDYDAVAWVNVLVGFSANTPYSLELAIDTVNHPDQYRVRVAGGTWTAWIGANGTLTVLNHFQLENSSSNGTIYFDAIGIGSGSLTNPILAYTSLTQGVLTT